MNDLHFWLSTGSAATHLLYTWLLLYAFRRKCLPLSSGERIMKTG